MNISLYYPVKPYSVNQPFGVNGQYYRDHGVNILGHNGVDLQALHGQPVYASHDGTCYPEEDENQGFGVVIISDTPFDYNGGQCYMKTIYWHFISDIYVKSGQHVKAGDYLGHADSTGLSNGDHLHYSLKPVINSNEAPFAWATMNPDNGYFGCIDPTPYFNSLYAEDITTSRYPFLVNMGYGDSNEEVRQLQVRLKKMGLFDPTQTCTGFYGPKTASAVLAFQKEYNVDDPVTIQNLGGKSCGPKTRAQLNLL